MDGFVPKYTYYLATTLDVCSSHGGDLYAPMCAFIYITNKNPMSLRALSGTTGRQLCIEQAYAHSILIFQQVHILRIESL